MNAEAKKTIVLTGALSPARFSDSDATFNIGMAFATAQTLPAGVYVAMNGRVFRGDGNLAGRPRLAQRAKGRHESIVDRALERATGEHVIEDRFDTRFVHRRGGIDKGGGLASIAG